LFSGLWLALLMTVVLVVLGLLVSLGLSRVGIHPEVLVILQPYLVALLWSVPPLLGFTVLRRYLQAMHATRPIMVAVILANVVNIIANLWFVYGGFGVAAMGTIGSAYATLAARVCMVTVLAVVVAVREHRRPSGLHDVPAGPDLSRIWQMVRLGAPAAAQLVLEVGVFAAAAALAGRISPSALAANQIVLNIASFFFMVPLGLSSAAAVRVGYAIGRGDLRGARRAGWSAILLALAAAAIVAASFLLVPERLLAIFTDDPGVVGLGVTLLLVCAVFQPFDGLQAVATGALRGAGDTRTPMLCNLAGHWMIGLPVAYVLCFHRGWGVVGLWVGLSVGLILVGTVLLVTWHIRSVRPLMRSDASA
jgi:MATE family multidrug resistance protein